MKLNLIFSCCENTLFSPKKFCEIVIIPVETKLNTHGFRIEFVTMSLVHETFWMQHEVARDQEVNSCCPFSMFFPGESWPATAIGRAGSHTPQLLLPPFKDCNHSYYEVVRINQTVLLFFLLTPSIQGTNDFIEVINI